jgi:hypothetical protein
MAKALFIKRDDITRNTSLSGSVDSNKFLQYVQIAQEIHIQNLIGTDLYEKLETLIIDSDGALPDSDYKNLIDDYIKPLLIHFGMCEYLAFASYSISNAGVYKHSIETSETASKEEIDLLISKHKTYADYYSNRLIDYLCTNGTRDRFPEYYTNTEDDIYPDKQVTYTPWNLR